jgi:hypothetical protein
MHAWSALSNVDLSQFSLPLHIDTRQSCWYVTFNTVTTYTVLALASLSVGYLAGARSSRILKKAGLHDAAEQSPINEDARNLARVESLIMEECKMVRWWTSCDWQSEPTYYNLGTRGKKRPWHVGREGCCSVSLHDLYVLHGSTFLKDVRELFYSNSVYLQLLICIQSCNTGMLPNALCI